MSLQQKIILAISLLTSVNLFCQTNLVPNSGFELCTACPTITGQYQLATGWKNCNGLTGPGLWGTPDYFNTCGTYNPTYNPVPPNTCTAYLYPHLGNAMMGIGCYDLPYPNYREYCSMQLSCALTPGNTYTVSFWVALGVNQTVRYQSSNLGVYLSASMPVQSGYAPILVTPHYEITSVITNTAWVQHTFTISPVTPLNWITLGNFRNDAACIINLVTPTAPNPYSYWYLDDISVVGGGPISSTISSQQVSCGSTNNGSATVTPLSPGNYTYQWLPGNQTTPVITNLTAGIYTVNISAGCSSDSKTVAVSQQAGPSLALNSATTCINNPVVLNASASGGVPGYTYAWSQSSATTPSLSVNGSASSVITCTVTDSQGCKASQTASVSVVDPVSAFSFAFNSCSGQLITTNTSSGATTFFWDFGDGSTSTASSPSYDYTSSGDHTVTLIAANSGCSDTTQKVVTVTSSTHALFAYQPDLCSTTVTFSNSSTDAASLLWNFGDGSTSTNNVTAHSFGKAGTYTVMLIAEPGMTCADTITKIITVNYTGIVADFSYVNPELSYDADFTNLSSDNAHSFTWDFGDNSISGLMNPVHTFSLAGEYNVCMQAVDTSGCADLICKTIKIEPDWTLYVPNTFTPNGDGLNDLFNASGTNISSFRMAIFDRWGELLFTADDIHKGWDGSYKGKNVAQDSYVWKITAVDYRQKSHELSGHINVIR